MLMKYLLLVIFLALGLNSFCQSDRFVFIQAKKDEPFYVRIGEKTFNSSSFGHLVIPRLNQDIVKITVGYFRKSIPEQDFELKINDKDHGYELNLENGNQLFLYEWQTSSKIPTTTPPVSKSGLAVSGLKRTDPFAMLMAGVVNDSLVLFTEKPAVKTVASAPVIRTTDSSTIAGNTKKDTATADVVSGERKIEITSIPDKDTVSIGQKPIVQPTEPFRRVVNPPVEKPADVVDTLAKISGNTKDSTSVADLSQRSDLFNKQDSVTKSEIATVPLISLIEESSSPDEKRLVFRVNDTKEKIEVIIKKDTEPVIPEAKPVIADPEIPKSIDSSEDKSGVVILNSDCQRFATDSDVDRLRIQMMKEANDDDRVFAARKVFRTKCFTVKQVTALTELFKDDPSRYMFFDAAYPFVYDSGNFKSLISFLNEEYYISRFKALVRMQIP